MGRSTRAPRRGRTEPLSSHSWTPKEQKRESESIIPWKYSTLAATQGFVRFRQWLTDFACTLFTRKQGIFSCPNMDGSSVPAKAADSGSGALPSARPPMALLLFPIPLSCQKNTVPSSSSSTFVTGRGRRERERTIVPPPSIQGEVGRRGRKEAAAAASFFGLWERDSPNNPIQK